MGCAIETAHVGDCMAALNTNVTSDVLISWRQVVGQTDEDLTFLLAHDSDLFSRWEASQRLGRQLMLSLYVAAASSQVSTWTFAMCSIGALHRMHPLRLRPYCSGQCCIARGLCYMLEHGPPFGHHPCSRTTVWMTGIEPAILTHDGLHLCIVLFVRAGYSLHCKMAASRLA